MKIGKYELGGRIGRGGMAEVFRATATGPAGFEKALVIKRILPELSDDSAFVEMFLEEAKLAAQLNHPNIVQVFDFGEADGSFFLAMELVEGVSLRGILKRRSAPPTVEEHPLWLKVASLVCEGLAYAHELADPKSGRPLGLVHRDVTPDNIMVARTGSVKLLDFGIAKSKRAVERTGVGRLRGNVAYVAPERIRGQIGPSVDVYSLGVVLYEGLTGQRPYEGESDTALLQAIVSGNLVPPSARCAEIPPELDAIILKAIAAEPSQRFESCRAMQLAIEQYLARSGQLVGTLQLIGWVERNLGKKASAAPPPLPPKPASAAAREPAPEPAREPAPESGAKIATGLPANPPEAVPEKKPRWSEAAGERAVAGGGPPRLAQIAKAASLPTLELLTREAELPAAAGPEDEVLIGVELAAVDEPASQQPKAPESLVETSDAFRELAPGPEAIGGPELERLRHELANEPLRNLGQLTRLVGPFGGLDRRAPALLAPMVESAILALLVAEQYRACSILLEQAEAQDNGWLVERFRQALGRGDAVFFLCERCADSPPRRPAELAKLLALAGSAAVVPLLDALEEAATPACEQAACEALSALAPIAPEAIAERLERPEPRRVASLCYVLEKARHPARFQLYRKLGARRVLSLRVEMMEGLARAGSPDSWGQVGAALAAPEEELRLGALRSLAFFEPRRTVPLLRALLASPVLETRSAKEKAAVWAALGATGDAWALESIKGVLLAKTPVLNRKRAIEAKLLALDGLLSWEGAEREEALQALLDPAAQPLELIQAARARLASREKPAEPAASAQPGLEQRRRAVRSVVCELASLSRAASALGAGEPVLAGSLERLRQRLNAAMRTEGRFDLAAGPKGITVNGGQVSLALSEDRPDPLIEWARWLAARGIGGLKVGGPLGADEARDLVRVLAEGERASDLALQHVQLVSSFDPAARRSARCTAPERNRRAKALFNRGVELILGEMELQQAGGIAPPDAAEPVLEELTDLYLSRQVGFVGMVPSAPGWRALAIHHMNVVVGALAFAGELRLRRPLALQLATAAFLHDRGRVDLPDSLRFGLGQLTSADRAALEQARLRSGWLALARSPAASGIGQAVAICECLGDSPEAAAAARAPGRPKAGLASELLGLCKAFDMLTTRTPRRAALSPADAIARMKGPLASCFRPDLLAAFASLASRQRLAPIPKDEE